MNIIDKAAEAEVAPLDIKVHHLQLLAVAVEWEATAAGLAKQAQKVQTDFVAYSIIKFQALALAVMQKSISLNVGKDF